MDKNILIVNYNLEAVDRIKHGLRGLDANVFSAQSTHEVLQYLADYDFSLIILDAEISAADDHRLLIAIQKSKITPILVLSSQHCHLERMCVLKAGAHAYIGEPYSLEECLAQAQALMQLYCNFRQPDDICYTLAFGKNLEINPLSRQVWLNGKDLRLTRKEFDLLFHLASNPGRVFSWEQLYDQVWNEHTTYNVDEAVKAQIKTLRQKLSITGYEYIKNVWGIGYRFHTEPDDE